MRDSKQITGAWRQKSFDERKVGGHAGAPFPPVPLIESLKRQLSGWKHKRTSNSINISGRNQLPFNLNYTTSAKNSRLFRQQQKNSLLSFCHQKLFMRGEGGGRRERKLLDAGHVTDWLAATRLTIASADVTPASIQCQWSKSTSGFRRHTHTHTHTRRKRNRERHRY